MIEGQISVFELVKTDQELINEIGKEEYKFLRKYQLEYYITEYGIEEYYFFIERIEKYSKVDISQESKDKYLELSANRLKRILNIEIQI